jgi:sugar/nucleoside kinase (ribokinase family)
VLTACDVLGIGECSLDEIARVEAAPALGGKARMRERRRLAGGQIASAVLGCARLGYRAALVSSVGADADAEIALAGLQEAGVDLSGVRRVASAATRSAWIWVEAGSGERTVLWQRDAALALGEDAIAREDVERARLVLVDATDLALSLRAASLARASGRPCVVDADAPADGVAALLALASHPVIPESLAVALFGGAVAAVRRLAEAGAALPIVTCGRGGAVAWIGGEALALPAFAISAVDATGAGDAFHAGVAHGVLAGLSPGEVVRVAHAVAACACLAHGAQAGLPNRAALAAFLASPPPPAPLHASGARAPAATPPRAR